MPTLFLGLWLVFNICAAICCALAFFYVVLWMTGRYELSGLLKIMVAVITLTSIARGTMLFVRDAFNTMTRLATGA